MQTYEKDGYILIGDLFWPTPLNNKHPNIQKLKKETGVDLFVKVKGVNFTNYGFTKKSIYNKRIKKLVSLGAFLLNFYEDNAVDIIIVVRLAEDVAGLLALKNGNIIPKDGDMIGTVEEVRGRAIRLIDNFSIGNIWTMGLDHYLYDDKEIIHRIKTINPHFTVPVEYKNGNSMQPIWSYGNTKKALKKSVIRPIPSVNLRDKKSLVIIGFFVLLVILGLYFLNKPEDTVPLVIPQANTLPSSTDARLFVKNCLGDANNYFNMTNGWRVNEISCTINQRTIKFITETSNQNQLVQHIKSPDLTFEDNTAILKEQLKPNFTLNAYKLTSQEKVHILQSLKQTDGINVQMLVPKLPMFSLGNNTSYSTKIKFNIKSKFSPFWFISHNYFNGINLTDLNGVYEENTGFFNWVINGEIIN